MIDKILKDIHWLFITDNLENQIKIILEKHLPKEEVAEECKWCYGKKSYSKYTVHWIENITCNRCHWTWKEPYRTNSDFVEDRLEKLKEKSEPKKIEPLQNITDCSRKRAELMSPDILILRDKLNEIIEVLNSLIK